MVHPRIVVVALSVVAALGTAAAQPAPTRIDNATIDRATLDRGLDLAIDDRGGVVVLTEVAADGLGHALGLRAGDTVVAVDGELVATAPALVVAGHQLRYRTVAYIEIVRSKKPLLLRRVITGAPPSVAPAPAPAESPAPDPDVSAELDRLIKPLGGDVWEVDVAGLLADPMRLARGARIVPSVKDGKPNGFKLYSIRPNSLWARLGLANGDTVRRVDGTALTSPDVALEVYGRVRQADRVVVDVVRRGKPVVLTYVRRASPAAPRP